MTYLPENKKDQRQRQRPELLQLPPEIPKGIRLYCPKCGQPLTPIEFMKHSGIHTARACRIREDHQQPIGCGVNWMVTVVPFPGTFGIIMEAAAVYLPGEALDQDLLFEDEKIQDPGTDGRGDPDDARS